MARMQVGFTTLGNTENVLEANAIGLKAALQNKLFGG